MPVAPRAELRSSDQVSGTGYLTYTYHRPAPRFRAPSARAGFTLLEVLVATVLVLIMLATVVSVFANMSDSMRDSRAMIEVNDRLRYTKDRLQLDLAGVTVTMLPPRRPESGEGYFEYIEGPIGPILQPMIDADEDGVRDTPESTIGDTDDILMFTTRSSGESFIGKAQTGNGTAQSQVAEVCWFLRGTTLYRRQLLVAPGLETTLTGAWATSPGFYANNDISARQQGGTHDWRTGGTAPFTLRLNTLGDLTKRENRYGHQPWAFPHDARFWGVLGLPTLRECSSTAWPFPLTQGLVGGATDTDSPYYGATQQYIIPSFGGTAATVLPTATLEDGASVNPPVVNLVGVSDPWSMRFPWQTPPPSPQPVTDGITGTLVQYATSGTRLSDDVILTNVLSFDVKAWDPGAPVFQDTTTGELITASGEYPEHTNFKSLASGFFTAPNFSAVTTTPVAFGSYVDLNYFGGTGSTVRYPQSDFPTDVPQSSFFGPFFRPGNDKVAVIGHPLASVASLTNVPPAAPSTYDTWSTHYEHDGFDQDNDGLVDEGTNGFDDDTVIDIGGVPTPAKIGGVDDETEKEAPPPYPVPLRGIQVKIRVFEPSTRQIREVTVVQDFVSQ
ncbi:MAG: prepilin-type N-terminal cleavage/methylation domain-containing protein [Pirellulales bacterium]|nr:prepilin-type N-terminal cleavage/methylation domain-containing protein [Pirellulales bacterium]